METKTNWNTIFVRRNRLILVGVVFLMLLLILYRTWGILYPFIIGLVIAYLAIPLVDWLEKVIGRVIKKRSAARVVAISLVFLTILAILVVSFNLFFSVVVDEITHLTKEAPLLMEKFTDQVTNLSQNSDLADLITSYQQSLDQQVRLQIEEQARGMGQQLTEGFLGIFQKGISGVFDAVSKTISFLLGILIIPIWLFYVLNDAEGLSRSILNLVPLSIRPDFTALMHIIDGIFNAFLRGQLVLCLIVGVAVLAGLTLLGVPYAAVLALVAAIAEAIPMIGPFLGMIPALIIALTQGPNALLWTFILYMSISQVEAVFLKPRVMGTSLSLHPAVVMVVLLIGAELGGILGMILSAPVTAVIRDLFKYFYLRLSEEHPDADSVMESIHQSDLNLDEI